MRRRAGSGPEFDESSPTGVSSIDAAEPPPVRLRRPRIGRQQQGELKPPWYARVLRLRHLQPGSVACLGFLEGSIALAALLAFAELVSWWAVIVVPLTVAAMVKLNDYVAGRVQPPAP